jgi:hypothetical protein
MAADAEEIQEIGRRGVATLKRWLEATTFIELPYDAYNHSADCLVAHLAGKKKFDLSGYFLTGSKRPIMIESKEYTNAGAQYKEFQHFLCIGCSSTIKEMEDVDVDRERHVFWVTFHPFNLENWAKLESRDQIVKALGQHPDYLDHRKIDENVVRQVAGDIVRLDLDTRTDGYVSEELYKAPGFGSGVNLESADMLLRFSPQEMVHRIAPCPLLIIQGAENKLHHPEEAQALYDHAGEPKELVFLEGSGHTEWMFDDHPTFQRVVGLLDDFFTRTLPGAIGAESIPLSAG